MITKIRLPLCSQAVCACINEARGVEMPCVLWLEFAWVLGITVWIALFHGRAALAKALVQMGKVQDLAVRFRQVSFDPTAGPAK